MFASPVAYTLEKVPPSLRGWYLLNPMAGLLDALRWALTGSAVTSWWAVSAAGVGAVAMWVVGAFHFKRVERKFADVI